MAGGISAPDAAPSGSGIRLGFVLPGVNTIVEPWYASALPRGFSAHFSRMLLPARLTPEAVRQMDEEDGARALSQIASVRPHAAIYACFASSVVLGVAADRDLALSSTRLTGAPAETAAGASFKAMQALGMRRIAVVSPYAEEIDRAEHALLEAAGFEVIASRSFGITGSFDLAGLSAAAMIRAGQEIAPGADGLFLSCMNTPSHLAIAELERETGLPVVTATSATLWAALRLAGFTGDPGRIGRLGVAAFPG